MYPPGKFETKNPPLLTLIHGGPNDADGNHFEADWYQWDRLAATNGWLVFEPNYRGSTGYGDKFILGIIHEMVSRPGKDILAGVDALVKDGIADPDHETIGGYSYGGYMTNWLITQTTRFKAAVTSAGAVEHVANWGNDDTVLDDAYFLGGHAWEAPKRYGRRLTSSRVPKTCAWRPSKPTCSSVHYTRSVSPLRCWFSKEKTTHSRRIPGMAKSKSGRSCAGCRSTLESEPHLEERKGHQRITRSLFSSRISFWSAVTAFS